jgi:hypothetical protein
VAPKEFASAFTDLRHPPYSRDFNTLWLLFVQKSKQNLRGRKCTTDNKLKTAVDDYFAKLPKEFFLERMRQLDEHWIKCISGEGSYVETFFFVFLRAFFHFLKQLSKCCHVGISH